MKLLLALALFAVKLPSLATLAEAVRGGDEVEIERIARRIGAARLMRGAQAGPKAERLAALRALPLTDGAWAELASLAPLAGDPDPEVAEAAAKAARRIAEEMSPAEAYAEEVPPDVPRAAAKALWSAAAKAGAPATARAQVIAAASALARAFGAAADGSLIDALLGDGEAAVRRAAVESLSAKADAPRIERALADEDARVAAAAGVALCAGVPPIASRAPSEQAAVALPEPARARVRALVSDEKTPLAD